MGREDSKGVPEPPERGGSDRAILIVFLIAAFVARAAAAWFTDVAAPQEIRYITVAQGVLAGRGFSGIDTRFPDIIQPPAYPFLIAALLLLGFGPVAAARGSSILTGSLLVIPIYLITRRIFGRAAARRAGWLTVVYPLFVHISGLCMTEPTFTLFIAFASLLLLLSFTHERPVRLVLGAGALLGLSFLTRPEGLTYTAAACVLLFLNLWRGRKIRAPLAAARAAVLVIPFLLMAVPYSFWLHAKTGHWLVAPKAVLTQVHNSVMAEAAEEGWPERYGTRVFYERVKFGLNEQGTELRTSEAFRTLGLLPDREGSVSRPLRRSLIEPGHLARIILDNLQHAYLDTIKYGLVLPSILLGFLVLGITSRPWVPGPLLRGQGLLACFVLAGGSWVLTYIQPRFLFPSVCFIVPWMGEGWVRFEKWTEASLAAAASRVRKTILVGQVWVIAGLTMLMSLVHVIEPVRRLSSIWAEHRTAGLWLKQAGVEPGIVLALTPVTAFYAGFPFDVLPYADLDRVLAYARLNHARYLVVDEAEFSTDRPQLLALTKPDLKDGTLNVVLDLDSDPERRLIVYELLPQPPPGAQPVRNTGGSAEDTGLPPVQHAVAENPPNLHSGRSD